MKILGRQTWILALATISACGAVTACDDGGDDESPLLTGGTPATTGGAGPTGGDGTGEGGAAGAGAGGADGSTRGAELVNAEGWVGGDPEDRTDDPDGVQGSFYQYGDEIDCVTSEGNPCTEASCCLDWTTVVDSTFTSWGCGIGLELNSTGGETAVKSPLASPGVAGFEVTLSGDVPKTRLGFTQTADTAGKVSPYAQEVTGAGTYEVLFGETSCPTWVKPEDGCDDSAPATSSHELQVQVVGGESAGSGTLCITSIKAILAE